MENTPAGGFAVLPREVLSQREREGCVGSQRVKISFQIWVSCNVSKLVRPNSRNYCICIIPDSKNSSKKIKPFLGVNLGINY